MYMYIYMYIYIYIYTIYNLSLSLPLLDRGDRGGRLRRLGLQAHLTSYFCIYTAVLC